MRNELKTFNLFAVWCVLQIVFNLPQNVCHAESSNQFVRIGHFQAVCHDGDFEHNLKSVIKGLELSTQANLDIVSFPESFLTGYFDNVEKTIANSFAINSWQMKQLLEETSRFDILFMVGFNEERNNKSYNTIAVIEHGKILGTYSKAFPVFGFYEPGREFPVFEKKGLKFGVIICADGGYIEPARILALKGAQLIFAPHYNYIVEPISHYEVVRNDHIARAVENAVYFLRANNCVPVNAKTGMSYSGFGYGDSYLLNPNGQVVASAGLYDEYLMIYNLDISKKFYASLGRSKASASALGGILRETLDEQSHTGNVNKTK